MTGYSAIRKIKSVSDRAEKLGFRLADSPNSIHVSKNDLIVLYPAKDYLPIYGRDAAIISASLEDIDMFLRGIEWDRDYLRMHQLFSDTKIARKEQDVRNRQLVQRLKNENIGEIT